jgi:ATP-dependent protease ClpP protease subunit
MFKINIFGTIGLDVTPAAIRAALDSAAGSPVEILIDSEGGSIPDGLAIYDMFKAYKGQKTIIVVGLAASIAGVIAMAGDKIQMSKNAYIFTHRPYADGLSGQSEDIRNSAEQLDRFEKNIAAAYAQKMKITEAAALKMMTDKTWISAADAAKAGWAEVVEYKNESKVIYKNAALAAELLNYISLKGGSVMDPKEIARLERIRVKEVTARCQAHGLSAEFQNSLIDSGDNLEICIPKILDAIPKPGAGVNITIGADASDKFRAAATNSICVAKGIERDLAKVAEAHKSGLSGNLHSIMRADLQNRGVNANGLTGAALVDKFFNAGVGSSDLPAVLEDSQNKAISGGFSKAPQNYAKLCQAQDADDFKNVDLVKLSEYLDVKEIPEGEAFTQGKLSDKKEILALKTRGIALSISRKAMINDDLSVINSAQILGNSMGRACERLFWETLCKNSLVGPTLTEDNKALFHTDHGNIIAPSNIPSPTSIALAVKALRTMPLLKGSPDQAAEYSEADARYIVAGTDNELTLRQLFMNNPVALSIDDLNPFVGITPIVSAKLQELLTAASKANAFYVFADPGVMPVMTALYLQGNRTPVIRTKPSDVGEALGFLSDVYFDVAFGACDFRGAVYCNGSAT